MYRVCSSSKRRGALAGPRRVIWRVLGGSLESPRRVLVVLGALEALGKVLIGSLEAPSRVLGVSLEGPSRILVGS